MMIFARIHMTHRGRAAQHDTAMRAQRIFQRRCTSFRDGEENKPVMQEDQHGATMAIHHYEVKSV